MTSRSARAGRPGRPQSEGSRHRPPPARRREGRGRGPTAWVHPWRRLL